LLKTFDRFLFGLEHALLLRSADCVALRPGPTRPTMRDVARPRIMAFDQIAVVGIHNPHSIGQIRGRERMQKRTEDGYHCR
jgi:hypothetical protein